jgi:hypothetical protein
MKHTVRPVRHASPVRDYVFRLDVPDEARRDALALRIEDHLWGDGVTFDRWTMRLTVRGDSEDDALKIARAVVRAATKDTDLYAEPETD